LPLLKPERLGRLKIAPENGAISQLRELKAGFRKNYCGVFIQTNT
jgi:hypothetical protein